MSKVINETEKDKSSNFIQLTKIRHTTKLRNSEIHTLIVVSFTHYFLRLTFVWEILCYETGLCYNDYDYNAPGFTLIDVMFLRTSVPVVKTAAVVL